MTLWDVLQRFGAGTSMHGVPKVIQSRSTFGRVFWSLVCLASAAMFTFQFILMLQRFFSYPKKVTVGIEPLTLPFPSVSVCNMRNLDTAVLNRLNQIFKIEDPKAQIKEADNPYIKNYMRVVAKITAMYESNGTDYTDFRGIFSRAGMTTNILIQEDVDIEKAGVLFEELVVSCTFEGKQCDMDKRFDSFFDSNYYNCFTFSVSGLDSDKYKLAEGFENGLSLILFTGKGMLEGNNNATVAHVIPGSHDYLSPLSGSQGVRVVIHPANTTPHPHTEGYDVPPGYSANFGVKARKNIRIGPPYGMCSNENELCMDNSITYRMLTCHQHCLQTMVVKDCGCRDISLPGCDCYPHHKFCADASEIQDECWNQTSGECRSALNRLNKAVDCCADSKHRTQRNTTILEQCSCKPACTETSYDVSYSLSRWPGDNIEGDQVYVDIFLMTEYLSRFDAKEEMKEKRESMKDYFKMQERSKWLRDFVRLNVYIIDSNVVTVEELPDFTPSQLLADIGGQLGLWVGISVITLAEVLELMLDICRFKCVRRVREEKPVFI